MPKKPRLDAPRVDISEDDIDKALARPDSFSLSPRHPHYDDMFVTWSLGPTIEVRDGKLLDQANSEALIAHLKSDTSLRKDWMITHASHFGCGYMDHLSFRAVDKKNREPTRIFRVLMEWNNALSEYGCADDSAYSQLEYDTACQNIKDAGAQLLNGKEPNNWDAEVFSWLWEHDQEALENVDDEGAYPTDEELKKCLKALGWLEKEHEE